MKHPDDTYVPSPGHEGPTPPDLSSAQVRHDCEVWTDNDYVCTACNFETAKLIARYLRQFWS